MMIDFDRLNDWWDSLNDDERQEVIQAEESGRVSETVRRTLESSGVVGTDEVSSGSEMPLPVITFMKSRH